MQTPLETPIAPALATIPPAPEISRRTLRWVDVGLILALFVLIEAVIAPGFARAVFDLTRQAGVFMRRYPVPIIIQIIVQESLILFIVLLFAVLRGLRPADLGLRGTPLYWFLAGIGLSVVALPVRVAAGLIVHFALGGTLENVSGVDSAALFPLVAHPAWTGAPIVLLGGVLVPLTEEIVFRGVLYGWLRKHMGVPLALLVSAVAFGSIHSGVATAVAAGIMGLILAVSYEYSKSLWVPVVLHALNNTVLLGFLFLVLGLQEIGGLRSF